MRIQEHKYSQTIEDELPVIWQFATGFTGDSSGRSLVTPELIQDIEDRVSVVFDDVNAPETRSNMGGLRKLLEELHRKYRNLLSHSDHSDVERQKYVELLAKIQMLEGIIGCEDCCGEALYFPWFREETEWDSDPEIKKDIEKIRKAILSSYEGGKIKGTYDHSTKTITFYTKNMEDSFEDYISVFAHECFHTVHHFLLDEHRSTERLTKYYHTVVLESLATWFQIKFLRSLGSDDAANKAEEFLRSIRSQCPIFNPYSGAKYGFRSYGCNFCDILKESLSSFEGALRKLISDNYECEIILKKKNSPYTVSNHEEIYNPLIPGFKLVDGRSLNLEMPLPLYILPQNVTVFKGMIEDGKHIGFGVILKNGTVKLLYFPNKWPEFYFRRELDIIHITDNEMFIEQFYLSFLRLVRNYFWDINKIDSFIAYIIW